MLVNVEQNKEPAGIKTVGENDNNNIQSQTTKEQTKNTFSKCSKNNNDIKIIPLIQNIVSTADLCCDINLKQIALQVENTQYNPLKFSGLIMRIKDPKTTALIFSNGKIICLGAKTEEDSKNACRKYAKIIKNLNYPVIFKNFIIQNIVGSCDVHFKIDLRNLYNYMVIYDRTVYYETELFPGLIYHYLDKNIENGEPKANIVFLIFKSGKMVITGAKKREQIYNSFNKIFPVLNKFKDKA
jgi:transcription initiation factor TFIID TATA-box-binding protein